MVKRKTPTLSDFIGTGGHQFEGSLTAAETIHQLFVEQLHRGRYQPRLDPDQEDLSELMQSIRELGVIEPLVVRPLPENEQYEILAGDRRWRAAQQAGVKQVPVVVYDVDDRTAAAIALVENLQRKDLNAIEEARALERLLGEFGLSQEQLAGLIGKSQPTISKSLGLLDLDPEVQAHIQAGRLEAGHGRALFGLKPELQQRLAGQSVEKGWSVRELERQKAILLERLEHGKPLPPERDQRLTALEKQLQERLGTQVHFTGDAAGGKGRLVIPFNSVEERENVLAQLGLLG